MSPPFFLKRKKKRTSSYLNNPVKFVKPSWCQTHVKSTMFQLTRLSLPIQIQIFVFLSLFFFTGSILPLACLNHSAALELRLTVFSERRAQGACSPAVDVMESDTRWSDGWDEATRRLGESENGWGGSDRFTLEMLARFCSFIVTMA